MRWRRASTILAMLAALCGAPSMASAAAPNQLSQPSLQPTVGTTQTQFVLSVVYRSDAGNAASDVTASVAGRTISMSMVGGTSVDGIWSTTTLLPAGSWAVTYMATAKGPDPQISGGVITVVGPEPTPTGSGGSTPDAGSSEPASPGVTPAPNPAETATPNSGGGAPSRGAQSTAPPSNASPAPAPGSSGAGTGTGARASSGNGGAEPSASPAVVVPAPDDSPAPSHGGATGVIDGPASADPLNAILLFGFVGVAAVAMLGVGWLLVTGRQRDAEPSVAGGGSAVDPAIKAIPTVEQRALRRARISRANDPILAALGLPEDETPAEEPKKASPRRRRAR